MKLEALHAHVERLLQRSTGVPEVLTDADGDWLPFPFGRALVFAKVLDHDNPLALVYGIAARGVDPNPDLYTFLNEMNSRVRYCRGYVLDQTVYIEIELLGESLDFDEFDNAVSAVASACNFFGPKIVEQFGGETPLTGDEPAPEPAASPPHIGQYL